MKKEILKFLHAVSIGVWGTCLFITIFYDNAIPMWISLVVMEVLMVLKNHTKMEKHEF